MRAQCVVDAPGAAWNRLADGAAVAAALPGGVRGATMPGGAVEVVVDVAVGAARGRLGVAATPLGPGAVRVVGEGEPGRVDVVVRADPGSGTVDVEGEVGGALATVGAALLAAWVERTATALFAGLGAPGDDGVTAAIPVAVVPAAAVSAAVVPAPGAPPPPRRPVLPAAVAVGVALGVGFLLGRARRST